MADYALTNIVHGEGEGDNAKVVNIAFGEEVKGLPADVVKSLKEQGAVGTQKDVDAHVSTPESLEAGNRPEVVS